MKTWWRLPQVRESEDKFVTIDRVCIESWGTIIDCTFHNDGIGWMQISPEAYIKANGKRYTIGGVAGIAWTPSHTYFELADEEDRFLLVFPPIPPDTKEIDLIEGEESTWNFNGIRLQ